MGAGMANIEHPFTVEQYRAVVAERSRLKSEKDEAQRQEHMAKAAENRALDQLRGAVSALERVGLLAGWLQRDRREPDKVLVYAQELMRLALDLGGQ